MVLKEKSGVTHGRGMHPLRTMNVQNVRAVPPVDQSGGANDQQIDISIPSNKNRKSDEHLMCIWSWGWMGIKALNYYVVKRQSRLLTYRWLQTGLWAQNCSLSISHFSSDYISGMLHKPAHIPVILRHKRRPASTVSNSLHIWLADDIITGSVMCSFRRKLHLITKQVSASWGCNK